MQPGRTRVVATLGTAQTLAWASSYYLPAMLARPMAGELGVSEPTVFAAFSAALVISALVGPYSGRRIDRWGGRPVLMATSGLFALGLALMAVATGPLSLFAAWAVMGLAMGSGLYEAAFASLVRLYGHEARSAITGITLIAGFASTVGWPLTAVLEQAFGWRGACWAWAGLHLLIGLPLNAWLPRAALPASSVAIDQQPPAEADAADPPLRTAALLAWVFAVTWFISTAMAAHLPALLAATGAAPGAVIAIGALVGPAQVAGRLLEFGLLRRLHPLYSARIAALLHPLGAAMLALLGAPVAAAFALLHGAGNGILTIAKGTLPLALFGPAGYGHRQGLLMLPARLAQALAPWLFGLLLAGFGTAALWFSAALALSALAALLVVRLPAGARRHPGP
ncbi:MFS transporter [Roseateles sp. LYH14W]|uniref:MFS transporter n=1 Tax=Pelomonas parva TaxID=3299032 RepID=A0ABW7F2J6_9BURK